MVRKWCRTFSSFVTCFLQDDSDVHRDNTSSSFRAKRRLKLTTLLMQQLIPPLSSRLMHGNSLVDNECATYSLAKLALEDACRLMANTEKEASSAQDISENKNMYTYLFCRSLFGM